MALTQISTAGVKDDAVTAGKIPANAVGSSELADNAVDTAAIANDAVTGAKINANAVGTTQLLNESVTLAKLEHGTSSNDGKFLRANNGADPSFETIPPAAITSIASDGANRVLTSDGDGTATAEGSLNFTGDRLLVNTSTTDPYGNRSLTVAAGTSGGNTTTAIEVRSPTNGDGRIIFTDSTSSSDTGSYKGQIMYDQSNDFMQFGVNGASEAMRIVSNKEVGINVTNPEAYGANGHGYSGLTVQAPSGGWSGITIRSSYAGGGQLAFADGSGSNAERKNLALAADHVNKRLNFLVEGATVCRLTEHGFHPNPADSAAANALDDYEEGSWTPSYYPMSSGLTHAYNLRTGSYVRIGRVCYWQFRMRLSSMSGNRNQGLALSGFPFNVDSAQPQASGAFYAEGWDGEQPNAVLYQGGTNRATMYYYKDEAYVASSCNDLNVSNSYIAGSGFFFVS